jgi:hypothetical protein
MNKLDVAKFIKSTQMAIVKHSPEILTGIGVAGMITSTVLAVKATPKALELINEAKKKEHTDDLTPIETVKVTWKCYIPAAVTGAVSVACIIGASSVSLKRNAALATAYKLSETALSEYKEQVIETIGTKKEQTVREKVAQKQIDKNPVSVNEIYITGDGDTLFLDPLSQRHFKSDIERIRKAENVINKQMIHDICGSASLNDFYDEIGLERTDLGDIMGWHTEHLMDLDIMSGIAPNGKPCLVIGHHNAPIYNF